MPDAAPTSDTIAVHVNVTNTGGRAGTEVVQLFGRDEVARVARPERHLVGFARVALDPGQTRTVRFTVDPSVFAYYDHDMRLVVEPGTVRFSVGDLAGRVELDGGELELAPERPPADGREHVAITRRNLTGARSE